MSDFNLRIEQTRKKLLDLTKRNKLINYRRPAKSRYLKIIDESPEFIYDHLVFNEKSFKFKFVPEPEILMLDHKKLIERKEKLEKLKSNSLFLGEKISASNQIEKIDVLKGESALKIAGEKGKNGVIKITLKK